MPETKEKLPFELTDDERKAIDEKCLELATKHNVAKVYPYVHVAAERDNERIIAYITEPTYITKISLMDKSRNLGLHIAADELRELCLLRDESHAFTFGSESFCDKYKLGVATFCTNVIDIALDGLKKK